MMKLTNILSGLIWLLCAVSCSNQEPLSSTERLNSDWQFFRVEASIDSLEVINGVFPSYSKTVSIPHTANIEPLVVNDQWQGVCYYAKELELGENYRNKELFVTFDAAMNVADVWLNGVHLTTHLGGYLPFSVGLNEAAKFGGKNMLVVRLDNRDNQITGPKPLDLLDFNTYGGIYRDVWLECKAPIYAADVIFRTSDVSAQKAQLDMSVEVVNSTSESQNITVEYTLAHKMGREVLNKSVTKSITPNSREYVGCQTTLSTPKLWSPKTPNLYLLTTEVYVDGNLYDSTTTQVGVRDIKIEPSGLFVNGERTHLRGVNRHQEYPYIGYALSDEAQYRDAYLIKKAGFDYVRASHYPQSPAFMKACDELGIFVLDAILGWQYFGDSLFMEHALQSSRELIRRDRNHPCVLAWELSINETQMPDEFIRRANQIRNEEAPNTYTAGWVKGGYDIYIEARQHRHGVDKTVPLIVSEYGDWEYYAQNAGFNQDSWGDLLEEQRTSRQPRESGEARMLQQCLNIQEAHNDNYSTNAFADGYWVMFDYNRGYADDLEYSGISDITRLPKFAYHFYASQRSIDYTSEFAKPVLFIASHWKPNESRGVRVFSNCDEVELYLDGILIAKQKPDNGYATEHLPHPPFTFNIDCTEHGELLAKGYYRGEVIATHSVKSADEAVAIKLEIAENGAAPTLEDTFFVYAKVVDCNGTVVADSSLPIEFDIEGGEIVNTTEHPTLGGVATIVVKSNSSAKSIQIKASGSDLKDSTINILLNS